MFDRLSPLSSFKRLACLFVIVLLSLLASAQTRKQPYTLLWRISGKDLKEPSYLFGTMHVKDKRVFGFSDSVMLAIQKCKSFALEVHPDSTVTTLFTMLGKSDTSLDLHKMLSDTDYKKLSKKFEDRNGYKMREDMNPYLAESMMQRSHDKPDDKESFVDAYLYGIARTMRKNVYGLENITDQLHKAMGSPEEVKEHLLGLLQNGGDEEEDDSEAMVRIYSTGNLDNVQIYMNRYAPADSELIARNKVMASGIIKHAHEAPIFVAVGAAHLPGDDGVIDLLRNAGYTVEPVDATFTGVASKFHIDYNNMTWVTHKDDEMGYSLDFPAQPVKTNIYAIPTWIFPDLATENFYGIYVIREGTPDNPANRQKVLNQVIKNLTDKKTTIVSRKDIVVNGLPGVDIVTKSEHEYERSVMFVKNNMLYYLYLGNRLSSLHTTYADRFFNSFKTYKIPEKAPASWIDFKSDTGAFTVKLPGKPENIAKEVANPAKPGLMIKLRIFVAVDTERMNNYLVRYSDFAVGNYMANKEAGLNALAEELSANAKVIGKPKVIWKDGYEGRELKLIFGKSDHGVIRVYVRGNRTYMLLKENLRDGEEVKTDDVFFNSFKFTPYSSPGYVDYEAKDAGFKVKFVGRPKTIIDSALGFNNFAHNLVLYTATSPTSAGTYTVEHYTISKYYRTTGIDSLYKTLTDGLVTYKDTLIKLDTVTIAGKKGRELITQNIETKDPERTRLLVDGADVYYLESHLAKEELNNEQSNTFFTSFERTAEPAKIDLTSSKAKLIVDDLGSTDSAVYKQANGALSFYKFQKDELPEIYRGLQRSYPDDTSSYGTRAQLISKLRNVHDTTTIKQLQSLFASLEGKDMLRSHILSIIPQVDSIKGYDIYLKLLTETKPLKAPGAYTTFRPLHDSLAYTADHFQQLIPLTPDSAYKDEILMLANTIASQDKPEYNKLLKDNFGALTNGAQDELVKYTNSTDTNKTEYLTNTYKYLNIMKVVPGEPLTDTYTGYYLKHYPKGAFVTDAVVTRIDNRLAVNIKTIARLLDSMDSRYEVMEAYHKQKQMDKVPLKYKAQGEFARLCLYKKIIQDSDDEENIGTPEKLTLLGSVTDKGSIYYAYQFKQSARDSVATFIGIAGPYKPGSTTLPFDKYYAYTDFKAKHANWTLQAKAMIPKLREEYELDKKEDRAVEKK